jgi:hypothetical protein
MFRLIEQIPTIIDIHIYEHIQKSQKPESIEHTLISSILQAGTDQKLGARKDEVFIDPTEEMIPCILTTAVRYNSGYTHRGAPIPWEVSLPIDEDPSLTDLTLCIKLHKCPPDHCSRQLLQWQMQHIGSGSQVD